MSLIKLLRIYVRRHKCMAADIAGEQHDETLATTNPNPSGG
jgi:hypothetical protein